jgi:hypothetical protein
MNLLFFVSYLYFQAVTLKHLAKSLLGLGEDAMDCYEQIAHFTNTSIRYLEPLPDLSRENCIFLCNHRSGADFFVDGYLTGGAAYIGLAKAFFYFPGPCLYAYRLNSMILFARSTLSREQLYRKTLEMLQSKSIIIYPEGERNLKDRSLPLKKGFIKLAYENGVPVQVVITRNKEEIFNERKVEAQRGVSCLTGRSGVLRPSDHSTLEEWIQAVESTWDQQWSLIMK